MLKRILALTLTSMTLIATTESARATNLPDLKRHPIARRLSALQAPLSRLVRSCQNALSRLLVRLPIEIEYRSESTRMRGGGDISALFTGAKYTADQLTGAVWSDVIDVNGVREVHLSNKFPDQVIVKVGDAVAPRVKMIESSTESDVPNPVVAVNSHVPVVSSPGRMTVEVEIVSDPESLDRVEKLKNGFRIKRSKTDRIKISQGEAFSFIAQRDDAGVGRFGGIGISRAIFNLSEQDAGLLIFRGKDLLYGQWGDLPTSEFIGRLGDASFDDDRVERLEMFVETLPAARSLTVEDLAATVATMTFSEGKLSAIRLMKSRMTPEDRMKAAADTRRFLRYSDDADRAVRMLLCEK